MKRANVADVSVCASTLRMPSLAAIAVDHCASLKSRAETFVLTFSMAFRSHASDWSLINAASL
jgi:hypothetical protein